MSISDGDDVQFTHEPLDTPTSQIRLLQIWPADKAAPITISIETHDRLTAPAYSALSYTWGDAALCKRVLANGNILNVTENCWYALGQLRLSGFAGHYWVDQLCINQTDAVEKSAQVNLMGGIFRNATSVLVSLGRHTKETSFLFSLIAKNGISCPVAEPSDDIQIEDWIKAMDDATLAKLLSAYTAFGRMNYWKRLWTAQEFALPSTVIIVCGNGCLSWDIFVALHAMLCKLFHINRGYYRGKVAFNYSKQTIEDLPIKDTQTLRSTVRRSLPKLADFSKVILQHGMRDCADVRDRIFGLLSLVEWSGTGAQLLADYTIPKTDLAMRAFLLTNGEYDILMSHRLLKMMDIATDDKQMVAFWNARRLNTPGTTELGHSTHLPLTLTQGVGHFTIGFGMLSPISHSWNRIEFEEQHLYKLYKSAVLDPSISTTAYVCSLARAGDIVLQIMMPSVGLDIAPESRHAALWDETNELYDKAGLVLRQITQERYEIIGHAYFSSNDPALSWRTQFDMADIDLYLGKEDLLFWTWQLYHLRRVKGLVEDPEVTLEQLATRFCGKMWSSCAMKGDVSSEKAVMHDTAVAAAHLTRNAADVRQALALKKLE